MCIVVTLSTSGILKISLLLYQHIIIHERLTASDSHATYITVPKQPFTSPTTNLNLSFHQFVLEIISVRIR